MIKNVLVILSLPLLKLNALAQSNEKKGWFFLNHKQKLSKKWDGLVDVQFRSSDKLKHIQTILLRSALLYNFNDEHAAALGYAYKADWENFTDRAEYQLEHRIYQQYLYNHNLKLTELNVRFRLEQRFVKEKGSLFSQRFRSLLSFQIPLFANKDFSKGLYTGLQNELFLNVQHKANINNSLFDQNRAYISLGYRWSKKLETELGYMNWQQKEKEGTSISNVFQLMINTDL